MVRFASFFCPECGEKVMEIRTTDLFLVADTSAHSANAENPYCPKCKTVRTKTRGELKDSGQYASFCKRKEEELKLNKE